MKEKIPFKIEKCEVRVKSRKLNARWSIDTETEIVSLNGLFGEDDGTRYQRWKKLFPERDRGFMDYVKNVKPTVDSLREL